MRGRHKSILEQESLRGLNSVYSAPAMTAPIDDCPCHCCHHDEGFSPRRDLLFVLSSRRGCHHDERFNLTRLSSRRKASARGGICFPPLSPGT